jgi:glycosyltransferase involved in cell wall biosynthesis
MIASWLARVPGRIVTRHYSDYHHVYNPSAVTYDKIINRCATVIIAISQNVWNILVKMENVSPKKVRLIHHGISFEDYAPGAVSAESINAIKEKYEIGNRYPVIGMISKFVEWKGIQYVIPAFSRLLEFHPDAVLVLANAHGPYRDEVLKLLKHIPEENYRLIRFEDDITALYKSFDLFVHVPVATTSEAFGQVYLESLASGIPSVFTLSGVAPEFLKHGESCLVVPFRNSEAIYDALLYLINHPQKADELRVRGNEAVKRLFDVRIKFTKLELIYLNVLDV